MNNFNDLCFAAPSLRRAAPDRHSAQDRQGRLGQWMARIRLVCGPAPRLSEADRLAALQHFLAAAFEGCWGRMSRRDQHLYRMLLRATSLKPVQQLRFECFDLMCRLLGEGVARARQQQIDGWLTDRR